jgi:hypothetical protein
MFQGLKIWLLDACYPAAQPVGIPREANPKVFEERRGPPERTGTGGNLPRISLPLQTKGNSVVQSRGFPPAGRSRLLLRSSE